METTQIYGQVEHFGPEEAKAVLSGSRSNYRRLSKKRKAVYANLMRKGLWRVSVLLFGEDGSLVDGQTRMNAVIESETRQCFFCVYNWPERAIAGLDNGQSRSKGQVLMAERGATQTATIGALVCCIHDPFAPTTTNVETLALYDQYADLAYELHSIIASPSVRQSITTSVFGRAILKNPSRKADILSAFRKMHNLDFSEPRMSGLRFYYRGKENKSISASGGHKRKGDYLKCARALLSYLRGEQIMSLYACREDPFDFHNNDQERG